MQVRIEKRYMLLPVEKEVQEKRLLFRENGRICVEFKAGLSAVPDCVMPYDMREYVGKTLEMELRPDVEFTPTFVDSLEQVGLVAEKYRPLVHFSPRWGWMNDPNGLVFYEGQYHMFFQHNPVGARWGNMHWGHAVSSDLIHWEEREEILFPDENGTMFSGCAVIDEKNVTGLQSGEHAPLLLFYTAAGGFAIASEGKPFTQRLAYSVDGGNTFVKYEKCIVEHIAGHNRDPKVIYCDEWNAWLMVLYLDGREYVLLRSENLLDWTQVQRVCIPEEDECPDMYPLELDGEKWWTISGAHACYLVGKMTGEGFVPVQSPIKRHYGKGYAAQTFYGAPDGRRIHFAWNTSHIPAVSFESSMSTPHDMSLKRIDGQLHLCAWPSAEFDALRGEKAEGMDELSLAGAANDMELTIPAQGIKEICLFGLKMMLDTEKGVLSAEKEEMPVRAQDGEIRLRIVQDVHSVEVYAGSGETTMCLAYISDALMKRISCPGAQIRAWALK